MIRFFKHEDTKTLRDFQNLVSHNLLIMKKIDSDLSLLSNIFDIFSTQRRRDAETERKQKIFKIAFSASLRLCVSTLKKSKLFLQISSKFYVENLNICTTFLCVEVK